MIAIAGLAAAGGVAFHHYRHATPDQPLEQVARVLAAAEFPGLDGRRWAIKQWQGKVVVVNFWATWCPPCLEELPEFIELSRHYEGRGVQFVGIAVDETRNVRDFAARLGIPYPILLGQVGGVELAQRAGNRFGALPYTIVLDRQGKVRAVQDGAIPRGKLQPILEKLVAEH